MPGWLLILLIALALILVPFVLIISLGRWNHYRLTKIKTIAFLDRPPLSHEEILRDYFPELSIPSDEFGKIWLPLGVALCINSKYLRPDDRFDDKRMITDYDAKYEIDVMKELVFELSVNRVLFRKIEVAPEHTPTTLRDYVYQCLGQEDLIESRKTPPNNSNTHLT